MAFSLTKKAGIAPAIRDAILDSSVAGPLPFIRGKWFYVDPVAGSSTASGESVDEPVDNIETAYDLCTTGVGDGIVLMSRGAGTAATTTSYLKQELTWSKHGITVFGDSAPVSMYMRSRVSNKTLTTTATLTAPTAGTTITRASGSFVTDGWVAGMKGICAGAHTDTFVVSTVAALTLTLVGTVTASAGGITSITSYNVNLITMSGSNNRFFNVMLWNGGTNAAELGGLVITGHRNFFGNCHITGGAGAAASASKFSVKIDDGEENTFRDCVIGSDTFSHGNNADCEVLLNSTVARNKFISCEFVCYTTTGTAHGAVKSVSTSGGSPTLFWNCFFNSALSASTPAAVFLQSGSVDYICAPGSISANFTAWGNGVFVAAAASAASAGGGLATKS